MNRISRILPALVVLAIATVSVHAQYEVDSAQVKARWAQEEKRHPHGLLGVVDSANAVTMEQVVQMGLDKARKRYVGKIVTFKGLIPVGIRAKNEARKNVCMQGFVQSFPKKKYYLGDHKLSCLNGEISVYFNFGDEISGWFERTPHDPADLKLEHPLVVPFDVCDTDRPSICNEGDFVEDGRHCIFSTERLLLAGKVAAILEDSDGRFFSFELRPTGLRY